MTRRWWNAGNGTRLRPWRQAKRDKAEIYFWDEPGFRADAVQGKTWGVKGHTPVVSVPGQRQGISAVSAVNSKGGFWFALYSAGLNGDLLVVLLRQMMKSRRWPIQSGARGLPAHKTRDVREYLDSLIGDHMAFAATFAAVGRVRASVESPG